MLNALKNVWLGLALIVLASALLLLSDLDRRRSASRAAGAARAPQPGRTYRVGVLYFTPHPVFEGTIASMRAALREAGFVEGRNLELRQTHPNADMSILPQTARQLAESDLDAIVPLSTPCLQAVVNTPRRCQVVFGAVSSPIEAGAGKSLTNHLPDVTGAIWTAPNPGLFRILKTLFPSCRTVGVVYNPSDANSMREKETAREVLAGYGMRLVERTINNSSEISQAAQSLLASGVEAVFGMSDNTVVSGFAGLAHACRKARVPLAADDNSTMGSGALFSCGASPQIEGRRTARLLARVLLGESPAGIPFAPSDEAEVAVDLKAAAELGVALPASLLKEASVFHHASARTERPFRVILAGPASDPRLVALERGVGRGLAGAGLRRETDFTLVRLDAGAGGAGDAAADLVVTATEPFLADALRRGGDTPLVFTLAGDPAARGPLASGLRPARVTGVRGDPAAADDVETCGAQAGLLAARILAGLSPAELPVAGGATPAPGPVPAAPPARSWRIRIARYNDAQFSMDTYRGILDGFRRQGLQEGRDFEVRCFNAQGDMTTLSSIMASIRADAPDLVMTISTPTLQAALRQLGDLPVVFGCVADGVQAGAGASDTNHLPNVTGVATRSPVEGMAKLIRAAVPGVRAVGTLFSPGEVNAEFNRKWFEAALAREGLKLIAIPINGTAEASEAAGAMLRAEIQVVAQIMDNAARPAYSQIARRAADAGLPFFCFDSSGVGEGATLSLGRDYYASGVEAAEVAVRVLRGARPRDIPFTVTRTERLVVNRDLLKKHGIFLPPDLLAKAESGDAR